MTGFRKKQMGKMLCFRGMAILLACVLCVAGGFSNKRVHSKSAMETTPIGTEIKIVIPDTLGDKNDDSMRIRITKYSFEGNAKDYYYLNVTFEFTALGSRGQKSWESKAVFYDKQGKVINREGSVDGYLWSYGSEKAAALGETYSHKVYIPSALAADVTAIAFQEHYKEPAELPADPSMAEATPWDNVKVTVPSAIASMQDDTMRARITGYSFENSETGGGYYIYIQMEFTSLGKQGNIWVSKALFYDKYGYLIDGGTNTTYGSFMIDGTATTLALGRTYTLGIEIPGEIADSVATIAFVEKWNGAAVPTKAPSSSSTSLKKQTITAKNKKLVFGSGNFKLKPGGKFYTSLSFKSSNTKIASVKGHGSYATVRLKKPGKVKITITAPKTAKYKKASKTITLKIILATPKLKVSLKGDTMSVSWNKVKGAAQYRFSVVQHGVKSTALYVKKRKLADHITKNRKYTIKVRAVDSTKKIVSGWAKKVIKT